MVRKDALGLFREHPDWFQKGMDGKVLGTADEEQYLDPTHPGARKFIRAMVRNARAEGFRYFKIDYNQVDHNCRYFNPKKTRFEAFRDLYTLYREEMGDSYLLACADYERATFGLADASRTGWDSRAYWDFAPGKPPICILEAIRCLGQTSALNQVLLANDPDVTYLKPRDTLTEEELCTWHGFVGLLGGTMMISEPLQNPAYAERARLMEIMMPPAQGSGQCILRKDREGRLSLLLSSRNFGDRPGAGAQVGALRRSAQMSAAARRTHLAQSSSLFSCAWVRTPRMSNCPQNPKPFPFKRSDDRRDVLSRISRSQRISQSAQQSCPVSAPGAAVHARERCWFSRG